MSAETATAVDFQKKFKYHHGNLREALLAAALDILATDGIDGLSLRSLARATGVTQAAPYSHFRDKDELLAAVAETGFQRLALSMAEAATGAKGAQEKIEKLACAYARFAVDNKPLFGIMFGRELADIKRFPTLAMTAGKSYALISAALAQKAAATGEDARFLTVAVWSLCHGLTTLIVEEKLSPAQIGAADLDTLVKRTLGVLAPQLG
ncbi:MAG TPA: TetR/AcrR family transcriptional regulator [Alphaproteobacteria bacterium]|nr:TetR/AcrR family transcriptional regulator [Alphaproteobacteria bacterium]